MEMRKTNLFQCLISIAAAASLGAAAAATAAPVFDESAVKLAPGVQRATLGYEAVPEPFVVANGSPLYAEPVYGAKSTGELRAGQRVEGVAMTKGQGWLLVGKDGVGQGYVSRGLLCPERFCKPTG